MITDRTKDSLLKLSVSCIVGESGDDDLVQYSTSLRPQYFHAEILGMFRIQVLADFGGDDRLVEAMIWSTKYPNYYEGC